MLYLPIVRSDYGTLIESRVIGWQDQDDLWMPMKDDLRLGGWCSCPMCNHNFGDDFIGQASFEWE